MEDETMKEKRILAMFITSVITLVASLSITFGVLTTLADPVVATGVTRYAFALGAENNSLIAEQDNVLKIKDSILFNPSSSLVWSDEKGEEAVWFNDASEAQDAQGYLCDIMFADESISTKVKVIPLRITNELGKTALATVKVTYDTTSLLGKLTCVKIYDYSAKAFINAKEITKQINANGYADYAVVVYADDSDYNGDTEQVFGNDYEEINVEITTANA